MDELLSEKIGEFCLNGKAAVRNFGTGKGIVNFVKNPCTAAIDAEQKQRKILLDFPKIFSAGNTEGPKNGTFLIFGVMQNFTFPVCGRIDGSIPCIRMLLRFAVRLPSSVFLSRMGETAVSDSFFSEQNRRC